MILELLKNFIRSESGAITVDFVIITAAIVGLGIGIMLIIALGIETASSTIEPAIQQSEGLAQRLIGSGNKLF